MSTQIENRSSVVFSAFTWVTWTVLGVLFSSTAALALDAGKLGQTDWQASFAYIQQATITGTLFLIGIHFELHRLTSGLGTVTRRKTNDIFATGEESL